jgi:hypothetical protein
MQQLFDTWMNAWRSLGTPPGGNGAHFPIPQMPQMPPMGIPAMPQMGLPQMPSFPGIPDFSKLAAGSLPSLPSFAGLDVPGAAIPSERLQKLQADYSREAMELIQQAATSTAKTPELKDRRFSSDAWSATPAYAFTARGIC